MVSAAPLENPITVRKRPSWLSLLIVLPWVLLGMFLAYRSSLDRTIATRQQTTYGTITAHQPANHSRYGYAFTVGKATYHGWEIPQKREYSIGEHVLVYYDPTDPTKNALTDFSELSAREFGPLVFIVLASGAVEFIIHRRRKGSANPSLGQPPTPAF